jgi:hypothetical protein
MLLASLLLLVRTLSKVLASFVSWEAIRHMCTNSASSSILTSSPTKGYDDLRYVCCTSSSSSRSVLFSDWPNLSESGEFNSPDSERFCNCEGRPLVDKAVAVVSALQVRLNFSGVPCSCDIRGGLYSISTVLPLLPATLFFLPAIQHFVCCFFLFLRFS